MFCPKCGTENEDGTVFCKECGASLTGDAPTGAQDGGQGVTVAGVKLPVNRNQLIGIIAIAVVAVLVIVLIAGLLGGGGAKGTAEKFTKAIFKGDGKTVVALFPDDVVEELCDRQNMDKDEFVDAMNDVLELTIDALDDQYDKWSIAVKATKTKDLSEKKIEELEDRYENSYDVDLDIKEAQEVTLELTATADGEKEDPQKIKLTVIQVDGKWYIDFFSYRSVSFG